MQELLVTLAAEEGETPSPLIACVHMAGRCFSSKLLRSR